LIRDGRSHPRAGFSADDPLDRLQQIVESGRSPAGLPVDQVGGLNCAKAEWKRHSFEQDRHKYIAILALARLFEHPLRSDGMAGPRDDDTSGVGESRADGAGPRLARRHLTVPEDGQSALLERRGQIARSCLVLARIAQENV
jgi:hypothetical protein